MVVYRAANKAAVSSPRSMPKLDDLLFRTHGARLLDKINQYAPENTDKRDSRKTSFPSLQAQHTRTTGHPISKCLCSCGPAAGHQQNALIYVHCVVAVGSCRLHARDNIRTRKHHTYLKALVFLSYDRGGHQQNPLDLRRVVAVDALVGASPRPRVYQPINRRSAEPDSTPSSK